MRQQLFSSKVVISNGFSKFHLSVAAAEAHRRGNLRLLITGAYPTGSIRSALRVARLDSNQKFRRLLARGEDLPEDLIASLWVPETIHAAAMIARSVMLKPDRLDFLSVAALRAYAVAAASRLNSLRPGEAGIYHYRAGCGLGSISVARRLGMAILCDHSIAHPALIEELTGGNGASAGSAACRPRSRFWSTVLADIEQADLVLVNSDFVRDGFVRLGWDPSRLRTIYLGLDDNFRQSIPYRDNFCDASARAPRLMFAGSLNARKGATDLLEALRRLPSSQWHIELAGSVDRAIGAQYPELFADPRVIQLGLLSRAELARRMNEADVFVFPSRAEGSARVVFEALACGCYVITTPNAGSIVRNGTHGALVPPGNPQALANAIDYALSHRVEVGRIGRRNAALISHEYTQRRYGDQLNELYRAIIEQPVRAGATMPRAS